VLRGAAAQDDDTSRLGLNVACGTPLIGLECLCHPLDLAGGATSIEMVHEDHLAIFDHFRR
jgi:hypothetical protein